MSLVMQKSQTANSVMLPRGVTRATEPGVRKRHRVERSLDREPDISIKRVRDVVWTVTGRQSVVLESSEPGCRLSDGCGSRNQAGRDNDDPFAYAHRCRHLALLASPFVSALSHPVTKYLKGACATTIAVARFGGGLSESNCQETRDPCELWIASINRIVGLLPNGRQSDWGHREYSRPKDTVRQTATHTALPLVGYVRIL